MFLVYKTKKKCIAFHFIMFTHLYYIELYVICLWYTQGLKPCSGCQHVYFKSSFFVKSNVVEINELLRVASIFL